MENGKRNGQNIELFHLRKLDAGADWQESDFRVVGTRIIQIKTNGVRYAGTMELYYGTPAFLQMLLEYQNEGKIPYFTIQVINDDKTATVGRQEVLLENAKFNHVPVAMLDADSDALAFQTGFSYTKVTAISQFHAPENYG